MEAGFKYGENCYKNAMAVFTHISEKELIAHLTLFEIGDLVMFEGISDGVENTNYRLVTTAGTYILTLFENRTDVAEIPFCFDYMKCLYDAGIPAAQVVSDKNGGNILPLKNRQSAITTFLTGASPVQVTAAHCAVMGNVLARMHMAVKEFTAVRKNIIGVNVWREWMNACDDVPSWLQEELTYLEQNFPAGLPSGTVHIDVFPDNVFFDADKLTGVIDFYFSCTESFVFDFMKTFNAWCFDDNGEVNEVRALAFTGGYMQHRQLSAEECAAMPILGRAVAMSITLSRLYDSQNVRTDAVVNVKDPQEYMRILRFHQNVSSHKIYGV